VAKKKAVRKSVRKDKTPRQKPKRRRKSSKAKNGFGKWLLENAGTLPPDFELDS
jgi:hypothetical protein